MILVAEFFLFSHGGHLGWLPGLSDILFKRDNQGPSRPNLVKIGLVVSEKIKILKFIDRWTMDDGRQVSHPPGQVN